MRIDREFYLQDTLTVASSLLGQVIVRETADGISKCRIVETEAYMGFEDKAAHSYKGNTERTRILFDTCGHAYIYMIYGMYYCLNISVGSPGVPNCVLIRAAEPIEGIELMTQRRKTGKLRNLCSGPGKLCMAMDIGKEQYGADIVGGNELYVEYGEAPKAIDTSKRINIAYAEEAADYPWRFTVHGSRFLSR
jgi:DNA-3-methyladenine glycosylase